MITTIGLAYFDVEYITSCLMATVMFVLSFIVFEIFTKEEKCRNFALENEGQCRGVEERDLRHSTGNVRYYTDHCLLKLLRYIHVRPLVEYCSPVWSPSNTGLITELESVQRHFTKSLSGISSFSYSKRLRLLNFDSREKRRLRADLMLCFIC